MGVFQRLGGAGAPSTATDSIKQKRVCNYWRAGKCNRWPCPFIHRELPPVPNSNSADTRRFADDSGSRFSEKGHSFMTDSISKSKIRAFFGHNNSTVVRTTRKEPCSFWLRGNCRYVGTCRFLHSWSLGDCVSLLSELEGHEKSVTGIVLPIGSNKLYTGSKDETARIWDCNSGQCTLVVKLGGEVGCMISEGPWIFIGLPNAVKAWNTQTFADQSLAGPVGKVHALAVGNSLLFAGTQDGSILAWKFNAATDCFEPAASLTGHAGGVVSLIVGANRLYSCSLDNTIRAWDLETLRLVQVLTDHTSAVTSLLCWEEFLLSCSLDKTIKVWAATENRTLGVTYTHDEERGLLALCGTHDLSRKPVLLGSCTDNCIRVYDLPSFFKRGEDLRQTRDSGYPSCSFGGGLFFTGDGTDRVKAWNWMDSSSAEK